IDKTQPRAFCMIKTGIPRQMFPCILEPPPAYVYGVLPSTDLPEAGMSDSPKTVLLVEDNEDNRIIYATALRYAGYAVLEAITGTEGLRQARDELPDLILMDISVPELDGWEATAILKADEKTRHIPVIAVTAHALPGDEERSLAAGC